MITINPEMAWRWTQAGDSAMKRCDYEMAISIYSNAFKIDTLDGARYLLPRITSCYRKLNCPQFAISFFKKALEEHGTAVLDNVVLTSVAGAYGDLENWEEALKCANSAVKLNDGLVDEYLENVFGRIHYNMHCN